MTFRERLIGTLRQLQPVLEEPGVLVVGSEVPNLLQQDAASTLVVSQDVGLAVPVDRVEAVKMRKRACIVRTRAAIRRWKYRQRDHAAGVWFRIRRVLADAKEAYVISIGDAKRLLTEGYKEEACGAQVEPQKTIIFVDPMRLAHLQSRRRIPVRLGPDFLLAAAVALVPFDSRRPSRLP